MRFIPYILVYMGIFLYLCAEFRVHTYAKEKNIYTILFMAVRYKAA